MGRPYGIFPPDECGTAALFDWPDATVSPAMAALVTKRPLLKAVTLLRKFNASVDYHVMQGLAHQQNQFDPKFLTMFYTYHKRDFWS